MKHSARKLVTVTALFSLSASIWNLAPFQHGTSVAAQPLAAVGRAATQATTASTQFVPGLPLLDSSGSSTGAAEPSIRVDTRGHVYVTGPAGVPTGGCPFWRVHPDFQNARNKPYEYLGKFDTDKTSAGGGDCDIATGGLAPKNNFDNLAVSSLSLADLTVNQSSDGGTTFHNPANPAGNQTPGDDRQWQAADSGINQIYLTVHDAGTDNIQISTSSDGGYTYVSNVPAISTTPNSCGLASGCFSAATMDNHFGNIVVDPASHKLYTVYVAPANPQELAAAQQQGAPPNEHVVYVAVGDPCAVRCVAGQPLGPITWTDHVVYSAPSGDDLAHIFPAIAIDKAGTVYTTWSDDPNHGTPNHIFMSYSSDPSTNGSWSHPVQVDQGTSHSNMFPWIVAGKTGAVDLVWYAAQLDPSVCPSGETTNDSQGVNNNCHNVWTVQFAQSLAANTATPGFVQTAASGVMHDGSICDQGLNCSLFGGNRTLADFFQVALDPAGAANVAYVSDAASPGTPVITYTRQCTGASALTSAAISYSCAALLPPPVTPTAACSGQNIVTDPSGDASNPLGLPGDTSQVDITGVSFASNVAAGTLTTTMRISNLSQVPIAGTSDTYYDVAWTAPNGKIYATEAAQPDPSGQFSYYYGEFDSSKNQLSTSNTATGSIVQGANGTISVTVPLSGVGSPTIPVAPGGTPAVANPYALTFSGEGALGNGSIFVKPDDRAPNQNYGANWSVCAAAAATPTSTVRPTSTATARPTATNTARPISTGTVRPTSTNTVVKPTLSPTATSTPPLRFGASTLVDDQREGGEPDIKVCGPGATWSYGNCGQNNPYASSPDGFSTTTSFVWRSEDHGSTYKLVPSNNTTGKPDACPGGGDTDLAVSPGTAQFSDYLNFIDLQGLTNFSAGTATDGGRTFKCNPLSSLATVVDRQWFGVYKNPAGATSGNGSAVYLDYDLVAGTSATKSCTNNVGGNIFVVQRSTDGGFTYGAPVVVDCNDGIAGNMQVNQSNGYVYAIHSALASTSSATADQVVVNRSVDGGATWTRSVVFQPTSGTSCAIECTVGQDFAVLAIDRNGGLYAVWSQANVNSSGGITGPSHIFYAYSSNGGTIWTPEQQVDSGTTDVNIFPWIAAGIAGRIDVVWYGTKRASSTAGYDSGSQTGTWYPYFSQSLNANSTHASFSAPLAISRHPNHAGGICTMGIGCTTGGDRSLADFFQVDVNAQGAAEVIWADTSNNSNTSQSGNMMALNMTAQQVSGPTLFGTFLSGGLPICRGLNSIFCQNDPSGDARYEANGTIGANVPKLDIVGSSLNVNPANPTQLDVRMKLAGLTSLPSATEPGINSTDAVIDFMTSWNYHVPGNGQAQYDSTGNIYYAYLEVNRVTGKVTAYDGNTCSLSTTKAKYLVYPGQHAITSHIDYSTGQIDLYVPLADAGNPGHGANLTSVIAHTVGEPAAAGPYSCTTRDPNGNPTDPSGQIFNVYDKTGAYVAVLP